MRSPLQDIDNNADFVKKSEESVIDIMLLKKVVLFVSTGRGAKDLHICEGLCASV